MPVLTTETRLSAREANDIMEYVQKYRTDYGRIQRYVWRVIVRQNGAVNKSKLNTEVQTRFSVSKRTANSVIYDMKGRYKALKELKKTERSRLRNRIRHLEQQKEKIAVTVNMRKKDAAANRLGREQLVRHSMISTAFLRTDTAVTKDGITITGKSAIPTFSIWAAGTKRRGTRCSS